MQNKRNVIKKSVIFSLIALFIYGVWWLFSPLASEYLQMKTTKAMTGRIYHLNDVYRPFIEKITYIDGHFIMFMTKPLLFKTGYQYIYISSDGINWQEVYRSEIGGMGTGTGGNKSHVIPIEFNHKCFMYGWISGGTVSDNCSTSWVKFKANWPNEVWENKIYMRGVNEYTQPLVYQNTLVQVFKKNRDITTNQLIIGYELLYATDDGVNWHKLGVSESVIKDLVVQNNLKIVRLTEEINYQGTTPIAYNLPQFPHDNLEAYRVLSKINANASLKLNLSENLASYGNKTYIGLVTIKNKDDYHFLISKDGESYQLIKVPSSITNFFADIFF
jgi:hypothetical protein